jgi:hypothetical protein
MYRTITRLGIVKRTLLLVLLVAAGVVASAASASADYRTRALYQIEITGNDSGITGGGIWLWIELTPAAGTTTAGTGDYSGADCGHSHGAASDRGDVTWVSSGGTLTISGVVLNGFPPSIGPVPVVITVPSTYGHYSYDSFTAIFAGLPPFVTSGNVQVQVAP